jgi:hypothetical protein
MGEIKVNKGRVYYYKIYNISDSADLERVVSLASNFKGIKRLRFERVGSDVIDIPNPPIQLYIDEYPIKIDDFDGYVTVKLEVNELGCGWGAVASVVLFDWCAWKHGQESCCWLVACEPVDEDEMVFFSPSLRRKR